jgi:hypothetical protein
LRDDSGILLRRMRLDVSVSNTARSVVACPNRLGEDAGANSLSCSKGRTKAVEKTEHIKSCTRPAQRARTTFAMERLSVRAVCLAAAVPGLPFRFSCVAAYSPAAPPSYLSPLFARVRALPASTALLSRCVLCFAASRVPKKQLRCYRTKTNHRRWLRGSGRRVHPYVAQPPNKRKQALLLTSARRG